MLEHITWFTHRHFGTNSDACIYSSLNVEVSQDQHQFVFDPFVEYINDMDLSLDAIGKVAKKNTAKRKIGSLGEIKAWSGLSKSDERINRLKDQLELDDKLDKVSRMD